MVTSEWLESTQEFSKLVALSYAGDHVSEQYMVMDGMNILPWWHVGSCFQKQVMQHH